MAELLHLEIYLCCCGVYAFPEHGSPTDRCISVHKQEAPTSVRNTAAMLSLAAAIAEGP